MNNVTARMGITGCAALAMVAAAAIMPASAQTTIYPQGTDCMALAGSSKIECANQANTASIGSYPSGTMGVDPDNKENYRNYPGAGADCAEILGNTKGDCAPQND